MPNREFLRNALKDFVFAVTEGSKAAAATPGVRGGAASLAASLAAPGLRQEKMATQQAQAEDRAMQMQLLRQQLQAGDLSNIEKIVRTIGQTDAPAVPRPQVQQAPIGQSLTDPSQMNAPTPPDAGTRPLPAPLMQIGGIPFRALYRQQIAQREAEKAGMIAEAQQAAKPPEPPPAQPNPTEASLAARAATGDAASLKALELLRGQNAPQGPERVTLEDGIFVLNPDGTLGRRIGDRPRGDTPDPVVRINTVDDQGNPVTRVLPRSEAMGKDFPSAPTADMRNKEAGRAFVARSIDAVRDLSRKIITKVGPAQRADAIKRGAAAVFGSDPQFRTYQDSRKALAGNLAVAQQGSRPSDADILAIWLPLVPDPYSDTSESMEMKWTLINLMSMPEGKSGEASSIDDAIKKALGR